jgi:hypothetical protein
MPIPSTNHTTTTRHICGVLYSDKASDSYIVQDLRSRAERLKADEPERAARMRSTAARIECVAWDRDATDEQYEAVNELCERDGLPGPQACIDEDPEQLLNVIARARSWRDD